MGPQAAFAAPAHQAAAENADAGNQNPANQNPGLPEPPLEVNLLFFSFHTRLVFYLSLFFSVLEVLFCMALVKASRARVMLARPFKGRCFGTRVRVSSTVCLKEIMPLLM